MALWPWVVVGCKCEIHLWGVINLALGPATRGFADVKVRRGGGIPKERRRSARGGTALPLGIFVR